MIKKITYIFILFTSVSLFSQIEKLNNYKYLIVSEKFDYLKFPNQYQTSSLTKFLLQKNTFQVFLSNEKLPEDLLDNRCLALEAMVLNSSTLLSTKNSIVFKDCFGKIIFKTRVGKSKEKDYKKAYQEAIRDAYNSMSDFKYNYTPLQKDKVVKTEVIAAVKQAIDSKPKATAIVPKVIVLPEIKEPVKNKKLKVSSTMNVLYAQPKNNGFQLVNTKPEVVFVILKSNINNVYIIKEKKGIFYKVGENWVAEYYENNQLVQKEYQIKF